MRAVQATETASASSSWAEIQRRYANEWVCLLDIECEIDGSIRCGRVMSHDASFDTALDQIEPPNPDVTIVHTSGLPLWTPRIEVLDEDQDDLHPRR